MSIIEKSLAKAKHADVARPEIKQKLRPKVAGTPVPRSNTNLSGDRPPSESAFRANFRQSGILVDRDSDPVLVDDFRRLKKPILSNAFGDLALPGANIVMLCSALAGAGKTFAVANLAYALSLERDHNIIMLDLDNVRGSLTRSMGLEGRPGFFDVMEDEIGSSLADVMVPTEFERLSIIPTGRRVEDTLELLNSQMARDAIMSLAQSHPRDIILLDTPPILSIPDGSAIVSLAGQALVIVSAGETSDGDLQKSLSALDRTKPIGLVLNRAPRTKWLDYYGGDYYATSYR